MTDPLLAIAGIALVCCGLAIASRGRTRGALWLFLAANGTFAARAAADRAWQAVPAMLCVAAFIAWLLWRSRRQGKRAPRAYGAKSWARLTALVRKAREAARLRPARRLAPQGS